jgi:transposase-like protein
LLAARRSEAPHPGSLADQGRGALQVPRSRTFSPTAVVRAYARREPWIDRVILACFVLNAKRTC